MYRKRNNTLQHTTTSCNRLQQWHHIEHTAQHWAINCNTLQRTATHCNMLQHIATHCNTLQHTATVGSLCATNCNTLQHTATHCNTLQHTATYCNTLQQSDLYGPIEVKEEEFAFDVKRETQHTATHCNTLQHTATPCNMQSDLNSPNEVKMTNFLLMGSISICIHIWIYTHTTIVVLDKWVDMHVA